MGVYDSRRARFVDPCAIDAQMLIRCLYTSLFFSVYLAFEAPSARHCRVNANRMFKYMDDFCVYI